jgi:antitoxin PrlF
MNQLLTQQPTSKVTYSTVSSKGQVTLPADVRKHLGVSTNDKIAFVIQPQGTVEVKTPKYPTIASLAGAAGSLKKPLSWKEVERLAHEDHVEEVMKDFR